MDLTAEAITVERGGRLALTSPAFCVPKGCAARLVGPNGAGKSTLLRALAGLAPMRSGGARLGDFDLAKDVEGFAQNVAYAGHLDAVKPAFTVRANLRSWAAIYSGSFKESLIDDALALFSLDHIADAPAGYCSAGQKRRLGLARLLVMDRPLWLLDEPTVSLDRASVEVFAGAVADHCAAGGVAIAATHIDIGLPEGPVIELAPATTDASIASDPFLAEGWS